MTEPLARTFQFDNLYAKLPERCFVRQHPVPVAGPRLLCLNETLCRQLGVEPSALAAPDGVAQLAGNMVPPGAEPLAMAYAGHQFGNFVPQLGDGRALLLGEVIGRDGIRRDIQLKGAGRTPFSRGGDGRAAIGPALREYIVSEAMAALGIETTRALAVVATGETVMRDAALPGAVLTRIARSHMRVGSFQFFACRGDTEALRSLADHAIARLYPEAAAAASPVRALLDGVIASSARLVAHWLAVGFIHGVMNTDNMAISGETIDYGPCAFMDTYDPATVYSSIDHAGRYAYANQPGIAHWNLVRLAECLLPLLADDEAAAIASAQESLDAFPSLFAAAHLGAFRRKLGFSEARDGDAPLIEQLLAAMHQTRADFTLTFRALSDLPDDASADDLTVRQLLADPQGLDGWLPQWRARLRQEARPAAARRLAMRAVNPAFIARNHRVQAALSAAQTAGDLGPLRELLGVLAHPYDDQPEQARYAAPPLAGEEVLQTFCGT